MKENDFRIWLNPKYDLHTVNSRVSNCRRVEEFEGDLDTHFSTDKGNSILSKLTYSKFDQSHQILLGHRIPIDGDKYSGTSTLKSAVNLYFKFLTDNSDNNFTSDIPTTKLKHEALTKHSGELVGDWPVWEIPDDDEVYSLISMVMRYVRFLSPKIIEKITKDNNKNREEWRNKLQKNNIDPDIYLWKNSPCAFPGVRRHAGSEEIANFKKKRKSTKGNIPDAFCLDDNSFPKEIWSFIFRGKKFQNSGPTGYALAHLADHKEYKNRSLEEFKLVDCAKTKKLFGLYSCPTNTVFIPTNLIRPTDFSSNIRRILIYKAFSLYGNYCKILPPWLEIKSEPNDKWNHKEFKWSDPVGSLENLEDFLQYRKETIEKIGNYHDST